MTNVPRRYERPIAAIARLADKDIYEAAFVFGSVARGEPTEQSDLDIQLVTRGLSFEERTIHTSIGGIPVDLCYRSLDQLNSSCQEELKKNRRPILAEAIILFDKTGEVTRMAHHFQEIPPPKCPVEEYNKILFDICYEDAKVSRHISSEPLGAVLAMHLSLGEVLRYHYFLRGRWWPGGKRLFEDISEWDDAISDTLSNFLNSTSVSDKHASWKKMINDVTTPILECQHSKMQHSAPN